MVQPGEAGACKGTLAGDSDENGQVGQSDYYQGNERVLSTRWLPGHAIGF